MTAKWAPPAHDRVRERTNESTNARIDRDTRRAVDEASESSEAMRERLAALDREWNIDRALMLNFAILGGLSAGLAMRTLARERRLGGWSAMFATQIGFLAYHAIRGWCPPVPVFRRLGFRTAREICAERVALDRQARTTDV
jgi:hypothetical protein